jgi:hypothetical protein
VKLLGHKRVRLVALAAVVAAGLGGIGVANAYADGPDGAQPNMVGGTAPTQNYPAGAFVNLNYDAPSHNVLDWITCGLTLVTANTAVGSAHCGTNPPAPVGSAEYNAMLARFPDMQAQVEAQGLPIPTEDKEFFVRAGSQDRTAGERVAAYPVWVDPKWNWANSKPVNDIMVWKLEHPLPDVQTVPLGEGPLKPFTEVFGLGWGLTTADWSESIPTMIQEMRSKVIPGARCADAVFGDRDLCVENPFGTDGPCSGDSGGPLLARDRNGVFRLYGNLSRFYGPDYCGQSPYVYTSTSEFRKEIFDAARLPLPVPTQRKAEPQPTPTYTTQPVPVG